MDAADLEPVFIALHRYSATKYHQQIRPGDFERALQELEGAFLSYNRAYASYLNPSVRDFVASVIINQRDIAEDILNSAARFKQIVNLWELAAAHPNSVLRSVLTTDADLLSRSLSRLLDGPSFRWVKMSDGTHIGHYIDVNYEGKVGFIAKVAAVHSSIQLADMASQLARKLVDMWERQVVEFGPALRLLEAIAENIWFLDHGGREAYRRILSGVVDALDYARADDWLNILAFSAKSIDWRDTDEEKLELALRRYEKNGANDERFECKALDELTGLRDSLSKLHTEHGLALKYEIERLDEDIAERQDELEDPEDGSGFSQDRTPLRHDLVTDDQVREMFRTLREGG